MIKVASYNIRKAIGTDRRRMPERILAVLNEIDADIVALQECDRRFGTRAAVISRHMLDEHSDLQAVPLAHRPDSMGWHGNALLVRKSAVVVTGEALHLPALEPRGAVAAEVRVNGAAVKVVGMHLDLSGLWRRRQAHAILAHLDEPEHRLPAVLMGDLNEWRPSGGCLADFGRDHHFAPTGPSFHARRPIGRLDRIILSEHWIVESCGVHDSRAARTASDHLPIWASLSLKN